MLLCSCKNNTSSPREVWFQGEMKFDALSRTAKYGGETFGFVNNFGATFGRVDEDFYARGESFVSFAFNHKITSINYIKVEFTMPAYQTIYEQVAGGFIFEDTQVFPNQGYVADMRDITPLTDDSNVLTFYFPDFPPLQGITTCIAFNGPATSAEVEIVSIAIGNFGYITKK